MTIFFILVLIFSIIIHEVAHGYMADYLGDPTARYAGRLTLNPIPHIDMMGSIILPMLFVITHSPIAFGWAKPVPFNPYNLQKAGRWGEALVAIAGPASNLLLAIVFGAISYSGFFSGDDAVNGLMYMIVYLNVLLCMFNLIPIPPLDGSKILGMILPRTLSIKYEGFRNSMEAQPFTGMFLVLMLIIIFGNQFDYFVNTIVSIIM